MYGLQDNLDLQNPEPPSPTGEPAAISGTPLFAAASVLMGDAHTLSTDLESLVYSTFHICTQGKVPSLRDMQPDPYKSGALRYGLMNKDSPPWLADVKKKFKGFLKALHGVVWVGPDSTPRYNQQIKAADIKAVCVQFGALQR